MTPFHYAFLVTDLDATRRFYLGMLGCAEGRYSETWVDFDFFGHQLVAHLAPDNAGRDAACNHVDGHGVPVPHFGVVLTLGDFDLLAERMRGAGVKFEIEPYTRFKDQTGEQSTMFFRDPSGNAIEIKAFADLGLMFAK